MTKTKLTAKERIEKARLKARTKFLKKIEPLRLSVFDAKIGDTVRCINLWEGQEYNPHLEDTVVTSLFWDGTVTDFSGYYRKENNV